MIGLVAVIGFVLLNAALAPIIAVARGESVRGWWRS